MTWPDWVARSAALARHLDDAMAMVVAEVAYVGAERFGDAQAPPT
jgi:hypothetical protein